MCTKTWSGRPDSLRHLSSRLLWDRPRVVRTSAEAQLLPHHHWRTQTRCRRGTWDQTLKLLWNLAKSRNLLLKQRCLTFQNAKTDTPVSEKKALAHLETELPARLEAPMSLKVSSPTCKRAKCKLLDFSHFWYNLQLLIWVEGGGKRHFLQTIDIYI